jgi:hypothetical protein
MAPAVPCILVLDPSMATMTKGTMPTLCSNCFLQDWTSGPPTPPPPILYPGVTPNGMNGFTAQGPVTAGLQSLQPFGMVQTESNDRAIQMYNHDLTSTPVQAIILGDGDSTSEFHEWSFACRELDVDGQAGYIGGPLTESQNSYGQYCDALIAGGPIVLAGGAAAVTGDWQHFPNGVGWEIPPGGSAENTYSFLSTRQIVYYVTNAAANVTVSTSTDGGSTWTALSSAGCAGAVTPNIGMVCDQTLATEATYLLRIVVNSGTVYLWNFGQIDTHIAGVVPFGIGAAGETLANHASTASAIVQPWYNDAKPSTIVMEWKDNGNGGSCLFAPTANPTDLHPWSYWFDTYIAELTSTSSSVIPDFIFYGSYLGHPDGSEANTCLETENTVMREWALAQSPYQTYVDNQSLLTNDQMQALGWIDTSVHQLPLGQGVQGDLDTQYLGFLQRTGVPLANDAIGQFGSFNTLLGAPLSGGTSGETLAAYARGNTSSPSYPSWWMQASGGGGGDFVLGIQRFFELKDLTGLTYLTLDSVNGSANGGENFLPIFQISNLYNVASGCFLASMASGSAGIYSNMSTGTLCPFHASNLPVPSSTQTVGQLVCIKAAGPPPTYGTCTAVSGAACTVCN